MKNIFKKVNVIILLTIGIIINGCETTSLTVQDSPNALNPSTADVDFFLNNIQQGLAAFITGYEGSGFDGMSEFGMEATRMLAAINGNTYRSISDPGDFDEVWATAYSNVLEDIKGVDILSASGLASKSLFKGEYFMNGLKGFNKVSCSAGSIKINHT